MTEKIEGVLPPEVTELIKKVGGTIRQAEAAAGLGSGYFGKMRRGEKPFSPTVKQKVEAALRGEKPEKTVRQDSLDLPGTCPQIITDLIKFKGSKKEAMKTLGTSDGMFYAVARGQREMPPGWITRAKAALGQPVIGAPRELFSPPLAPEAAPAGPPIPEFVPWDGKSKGSYTTRPVGPHKSRTIKGVPQPILDLLNKFQGNLADAARAVGLAGGAALLLWTEPGKFTEQKQRRAHAALHGQAPLANDRNSMGESFDKYETGFAICMMKGTNFDRVAEIADILNARMVFRKNTSKGWIIIYRMADEDLPKFKRLALRDAEEIVCP